MKTIKTTIPLAALLLAVGIAHAQAPTRYDFGYRISDDRIQVFDDGHHTRIALPEGTLTPTVIAVQPQGEVLLMPSRDGTTLVFNGLYKRLVVRWANGREVIANYQGDSQMSLRNGTPAAFGAASPVADYGTPPPPVYRPAGSPPAVVAAPPPAALVPAKQAPTAAPVVPTRVPAQPVADGQEENCMPGTSGCEPFVASKNPVVTPVAKAMSPVSVAVTADIAMKNEAVDAAPLIEWHIRPSDGTLSKALARWASGQTPPIAWEAEKDFPAIPATYRGDYLSVLEQVMQDTARSQFPLHACVYDNLIRILHASQSCVR